jgi:hypothetical protein
MEQPNLASEAFSIRKILRVRINKHLRKKKRKISNKIKLNKKKKTKKERSNKVTIVKVKM